jgi:ATP-dependent DNA helicase RecG
MDTSELIEIINRGEDSRHQFKADFTNALGLATELVAFANSGGGQLFIGVSDQNIVTGLTKEDVSRLNLLISNAASQIVVPPINPITENINHPDGLVMVVSVPDGVNKPYQDNQGVIWVKSGSDKRKATSREELQRLFQAASLVHADEVPVTGMRVDDLDLTYFDSFFQDKYGHTIDEDGVPLPKLLENMNLATGGNLNLAGALLFSKRPQFRLPAFLVKAVCFPGNEISEDTYIDSRDIIGKIADIFHETVGFILANTLRSQGEQTVNTEGLPELPRIALEELVANALIHRDYFVSAPVRVFVFANRVEIISPGHLPNNLTVENIKTGNSNIRNPILASFAAKLLPYRGLGSGILRALKAYPDIEFEDNRAGNFFKVTITRKLI